MSHRTMPTSQEGSTGNSHERSILGDLLIGALAGAAGVWVMDRLDWFNYLGGLDDERTREQTRRARPRGMDPAHVMIAESSEAAGLSLSPKQFDRAALAMHYGIGIAPGALYAAMRGRVPYIDAGRGTLYGLGLFLLQDEILNSASGLAGRPRDYPWTAHARGLLSHLVYGFVTDAICRMAQPSRQQIPHAAEQMA